MSAYIISHEFCDSDALPAESTTAASLDRDQFFKVCPGSHQRSDGTYASLGQPRCGDGTNYSFLFSRPPEKPQQEQQEREKIIIELTGGGACWDAPTCALQEYFLTFPTWLSSVVGKGCSDFSDWMLCAKTVGGIDFSEYTNVILPYCTQDVHLGDEPNAEYGVRHVGAHNLHRTLQWVFENFPNPSHIFITGCSAGGTPLPVVYDIINSHYKKSMTGSDDEVHIDVIADSSVFLTPSHFLENYLPNWNLDTVMNSIGFDFDSYKNQESYPNTVIDYALQRSKKTDQMGFVSHDADQVSLMYYKLMSGGSLFGRDRSLSIAGSDRGETHNIRRRANNDDDIETQWWTEMNHSMTQAMNDHSNFHAFVMEGSGHCSFGLSKALEYEGFEEWASSIVLEDDVTVSSSSGLGHGSATMTNSSSTQSPPTTDSVEPPLNISISLTDSSNITSAEPPAEPPTDNALTNMAADPTSSSFAITTILLLTFRWLMCK